MRNTMLKLIRGVILLAVFAVCNASYSQYDTLHYLPPVFVSNALKNSNSGCKDHYLILSTNEPSVFQVNIARGDGSIFSDYSIITGTQASTGVFNLSRTTPIKLQFNNTGHNVENIFTEVSLNTALDIGGYKLSASNPFFANIRHIANSQGGSLTCKGTTALGTNFFAGFQAAGSGTNNSVDPQHCHFIAVMATLNNTNVTIDGFNSGVTFIGQVSSGVPATASPITFTLNAGQSYIIAQTRNNITADMDEYNGIRIVSDKDIAVNTGSWTGPSNSGGSRDIGIDQLIPAKYAGNKYAIVRGLNNDILPSYEKIIVISTQPDTTIISFGAGAEDTIFGQGNYKTLTGTSYWSAASSVFAGTSAHDNMSFTSTQPILVFQTLFGSIATSTSSMNLIPPLADCVGSDSIYIHDPEQVGNSSRITVISPTTSTIKFEDESGTTLVTILPSSENLPGTLITDFRTVSYSVPNSVTDVLVTGDEKFTLGFLGASGVIGMAGYMSAFSDRDVEYSTSDPLFIGNGRARLDLCEGNPTYISIEESNIYTDFQWIKNNNPIPGETNDSLEVTTVGDYKAIATYCALPLESTLISVDEFGSPGEQGFSKVSALFECETFDGFSNNSNVAEWDEQSKDFNNAGDVVNGPSILTSSFNTPGFHPIPFFDASNSEYLKTINPISNLNGSNKYSFFMVLKDSGTANGNAIMSFENSLNGPKILKNATGYRFSQGFLTAGGAITADVSVNTDEYVLLSCISNGTTVELYANGKKGPVNFGNTTANTLDIGAHLIIGADEEASGQFFNGFIAEFILFDTTLTAAERQIVETYYGVKFGITFDPVDDEVGINDGDYVSNNGSVVWDYNINSTYHNSVTGLGLDECGRLRQWQNKDANNNDVVAIGIGEIASTVGTNPNSFSSDNTYFLWGRNTGAFDGYGVTDFGTTINGEVIERRVARTWKTQETGSVGSLRIQFNLGGGAGSAIFDLADTRLLVDTDDVFAAGATSISPTSYNNATGVVNFDHDFTPGTGVYFSLGSIDAISTPLPISLLSFTAELIQDSKVQCLWETESETNNNYYTIEKSLEGENWIYVTDVTGAGNSNVANAYSCIDSNPFYGLSYYRLSQTDFDGKKTYVGIRSVVLDDISKPSINIYPNPAKTVVTILSNQLLMGSVSIYSTIGQIVKSQNLVNTKKAELNIADLTAGIYYVRVKYDNLTEVVKLIVE